MTSKQIACPSDESWEVPHNNDVKNESKSSTQASAAIAVCFEYATSTVVLSIQLMRQACGILASQLTLMLEIDF